MRTGSSAPRHVGSHAFLIAAAIAVVAPVVWVIAAGFRTQISLLTGEFFFTPVLTSFTEVLFSKTSDFLVNYRNSLIVGLISTALCLVIATLAAWSLHRMRWPRWVVHVFLAWALLFHMIPPIALAGAWFTMARAVGLDNTFTALILAHTVLNLPMALWLMGVFVREVPRELEEAAAIDGASTPLLLRKIVLPIIAPGLAATGVLTFVFSWNEFAVALNLTMKQTATVPVAIAKFAQDFEILYTQMAASAALSILPALVLLLIGQRYIVKGLTQGAVK
ncbi:MAG: carbohydrate ABC transporter permease [Chelatococcus sp.]|jgi:multiple sugar transport system permease protein|uniref:carbohydrate ABC transporter permease n=1 Tax=unclassified Chelatococcus TaxID=2638111 RepID=UPI001BD085BC|nr:MULTISPECIES: carbohydrate ABC transporter permease [unclassified Chelatococcus]CAH1648128.1 Multiple sugar transport system permease protein [Hyphomicrobiales bacterium]MBS7742060.1 carbohydrate ABC transporter permease [Chelatococcus sp. HY11]MBX3538235.1 carbohydrate ABC transporter permease [Chelatococcus sp.]MBX3541142.1 carbohydrate ABC transporter permease [Chelatococcus sp.]MCO5074963.1 carbohydrate ABC transporter permease [Chelatococcus sp.]